MHKLLCWIGWHKWYWVFVDNGSLSNSISYDECRYCPAKKGVVIYE